MPPIKSNRRTCRLKGFQHSPRRRSGFKDLGTGEEPRTPPPQCGCKSEAGSLLPPNQHGGETLTTPPSSLIDEVTRPLQVQAPGSPRFGNDEKSADETRRPLTKALLSTPGRLPGLLKRQYSVKISDISGDPMPVRLRKELSQSIYDRYSKTLYIDNVPGRYCFKDDGQPPSKDDTYFEVNIRDVFEVISSGSDPTRLCIAEYENAWMELNKKGKADLWRLLNTPEYLLHHLKYVEKEKTWIERDDDDDDVVCIFLRDYGDSDDKYSCFTERLCAGLSPEELMPYGHLDLLKFYDSALESGMGNGEGRTAVFQLFQELKRLLPEMNIFTPVEIFHKTYTSKYDGCYVSDTTSSSSVSSSKKKWKPSPSLKGDGDARKRTETSVAPHKQLADMVVITRDLKSGFSKYIAIVEIHSKGKDDRQAQQKFLKEVLSALQAQDAVFGFLFSVSDVMYYYAKREVTGEINVEQFRYPISRPAPKEPHGTIHVGAFQMLIMDILAALVYGIHKFDI